MRIEADLHTHTHFSDGKGSIEENVLAARAKGLKRIAITDHGPGHLGFGIKRHQLKEMRAIVDILNRKYDDIEILLGLEANILNEDGDLDIDDELLEDLDILLAGYHFGSSPKKWPRDITFHSNNWFKKRSKKIYEKAMAANTKAFVNAMRRYDIDIITHPGAKGPLDIEAVAKVAEETHTAMEISASRHAYLTVEAIEIARKYRVDFTVNSDAHVPEGIGEVEGGLERAEAAGISIESLLNNRADFPNRRGTRDEF
ncbi:MAG: PHP domain-containing protein [Clostridia bacterium]|nr:PHP domain-containing protein [Clostridia bacterium]